MAWQDEIGSATYSNRKPPITPGNHTLVILEAREQKGFRGLSYIIEAKVLESDTMPAGTECGKVIKLDGPYPDSAKGDVLAFAAAVMGIDPADKAKALQLITPDVLRGIQSDAQPIRGHVVRCSATAKGQPEPGKTPYVRLWWSPIVENGRPKSIQLPPLERAAQPAYGQSNGYVQPNQVEVSAPWGAPPAPPALPPLPPAALPPGWAQHPDSPSHVYKGTQVVTHAQLKELAAQGKA